LGNGWGSIIIIIIIIVIIIIIIITIARVCVRWAAIRERVLVRQ
jgi:hypothetical protein